MNGNQTPLLTHPWLVVVNHLLRQKNAFCEDEFLWTAKLDQWQRRDKSRILPSRSTWPRILCGCCWGTMASATPRLCSSARFSRHAAHLSAMVLQKGGGKRTEVWLGFKDFWKMDVLFTQSCAATVKSGRLREKPVKRRKYWWRKNYISSSGQILQFLYYNVGV